LAIPLIWFSLAAETLQLICGETLVDCVGAALRHSSHSKACANVAEGYREQALRTLHDQKMTISITIAYFLCDAASDRSS
jgi:hypothetical protein